MLGVKEPALLTLPEPPSAWLKDNGYLGPNGGGRARLSRRRMNHAKLAYAYEQEHGRPFVGAEPGSPTYEQFDYSPGRGFSEAMVT